jgi:putative flippase GtrA
LWKAFGLSQSANSVAVEPVRKIFGLSVQFWTFLVVSLIGLLVNSGLLAFISSNMQLVESPDLNKNLAKIVATFASLVWNFIGYKLIVFRK